MCINRNERSAHVKGGKEFPLAIILAFAKNLQNLKRKKERNLKRCALFGFVLGRVEFYMDGWLALGVSHTPSSIPFTLDGGNEEFD